MLLANMDVQVANVC